MSEQELFTAAAVNTRILFPPEVKGLDEVMRDLLTAQGMPEEIIYEIIGEMPEDRAMYVITNDRHLNGAAFMLYDSELHKLAEKIQSDLYILSASIHEVIAMLVNAGDPETLAEMVQDVNMEQVSLDERLSNQVYHYDKDLRTITLATDTPNKRLDLIHIRSSA